MRVLQASTATFVLCGLLAGVFWGAALLLSRDGWDGLGDLVLAALVLGPVWLVSTVPITHTTHVRVSGARWHAGWTVALVGGTFGAMFAAGAGVTALPEGAWQAAGPLLALLVPLAGLGAHVLLARWLHAHTAR